jgi:hypothetical protein
MLVTFSSSLLTFYAMRLYTILLALLLLSGCRKQMTDTSPKDYERTSLLPGKNIISSVLDDNRLYVMYDHTVSIIETNGTQTDLSFEGSNGLLFHMNADFFATAEWKINGKLRFYPTKNPANPNVRSFTTKDLGLPETAVFPNYLGCSAVNDRRQCLVIAHLNEDLTESALFLFEVKMTHDGLIDQVTYKPVTLPFKYKATFVSAIGSSFIVSGYHSPTLLIDSNGHAQKVWDSMISDVLPIFDGYYGDIENGIVKSEDSGLNWQDVTNTVVRWQTGGLYIWEQEPRLAIIDGHYVMFSIDLYEVRQGPGDSFESGELDKTGLNAHILNICEWQGKVFVVTRAGIFTRSISDFFTPAL